MFKYKFYNKIPTKRMIDNSGSSTTLNRLAEQAVRACCAKEYFNVAVLVPTLQSTQLINEIKFVARAYLANINYIQGNEIYFGNGSMIILTNNENIVADLTLHL